MSLPGNRFQQDTVYTHSLWVVQKAHPLSQVDISPDKIAVQICVLHGKKHLGKLQMATFIHDHRKMCASGCLWDDSILLDRSVCSATWDECVTNSPLGEDVEFLDVMDRQNLVQVGG